MERVLAFIFRQDGEGTWSLSGGEDWLSRELNGHHRSQSHASITGQYDDMVDALKGHYEKLKLVNKHHVSQLLSLSAIGDDHESLVLFKRKLTKHIGGSQACHGADYSPEHSSPPSISTFLQVLGSKDRCNTDSVQYQQTI